MADVSKINGYNLKDTQARKELNNKADKEHTHEEYAKKEELNAKADKAELNAKADIDDIYVEVEAKYIETQAANNTEVMMLSDEGVATASTELQTYTTMNGGAKGYQGSVVSVMPNVEEAVYISSITVGCSLSQCEFAIYSYVKKYPESAGNKMHVFTKVKSCGIVNCDTTAKTATISFPQGEYVEANQLMMACGSAKGMGFIATDTTNKRNVYYYSSYLFDAEVGSTFETTLPGDWIGYYTTTYSFEQPEVAPTTNYTITNNLTNATNSNTAATVTEGSSYSATITANSGYTLSTVKVTMGGTDITSSAYSNGAINIASVTGNIVVTATAVVPSVKTYTITNNLTNATNSNKMISVEENSSYTATITANNGYTLSTVTVTMGGANITSSCYSNGAINISKVTGNIVITVTTSNSSGDTPEGTVKRKIKEVIPGMLSDIKYLKDAVANNGSSNSRGARIPINKYFILTVDDVERSFLTIADRLISIGFYPALALKMESINSGAITWGEVKQLQDMGFEIAFHGMSHTHTPYGTAPNNDDIMIADIAEFKALCKDNGIDIVGYCGPNHYPLPVGAFKEFEWARSACGVKSYGWNIDYANASRMSDSFASIEAGTSFDWLNKPSDETIAKMIALAQHENLRDNYYLTPMCHSQNIVKHIDSYMQVFEGWIAQGLTPMRCRDAVMQSLWKDGSIGNNSTFEIQAGTATNPYWVLAGNGIIRSSTGE